MKRVPVTHILYHEDATNTKNIRHHIVYRSTSLLSAQQLLEILFREHKARGAIVVGNELRILLKNRIIERWVIAPVKKERELNLK